MVRAAAMGKAKERERGSGAEVAQLRLGGKFAGKRKRGESRRSCSKFKNKQKVAVLMVFWGCL